VRLIGAGKPLIRPWEKRAGVVTRWVRIRPIGPKLARNVAFSLKGGGGPLSVVVAPANRVDAKLLDATIEASVVERPEPTARQRQNLCLDKAYDNPTGEAAVEKHNYTGHIRRKGEEKVPKKRKKNYPARRWVVERTLAWLSKCRGLLVRYEKKSKCDLRSEEPI